VIWCLPVKSGGTPIVGYRKRWLNIAKLDDLPANITSHMLRHGFASLAADLGSRPCRETDPSPLMDTSEHGFRSCYHPTSDQSHQRMRKAAGTAPKPWRMRTRGASSRPAGIDTSNTMPGAVSTLRVSTMSAC
jgi:hypothetical protein